VLVALVLLRALVSLEPLALRIAETEEAVEAARLRLQALEVQEDLDSSLSDMHCQQHLNRTSSTHLILASLQQTTSPLTKPSHLLAHPHSDQLCNYLQHHKAPALQVDLGRIPARRVPLIQTQVSGAAPQMF
jgi:hypothetical protein